MNKYLARLIDWGFENYVFLRYAFSHGLASVKPNEKLVEDFWQQEFLSKFDTESVPEVNTKKRRAHTWGDCWEVEYASLVNTSSPENNLVRGRYFTPPGAHFPADRPVSLVLPGWLTFNYYQYYPIVRSFLNQGFDCLVLALPYHLERTPQSCFSGELMFTPDLHRSMESIGQALADSRQAVNWLGTKGAAVGVQGISLGGLIGGLLSTIEHRLSFASLWVPIPWLERAVRQSRVCRPLKDRLFAAGIHQRTLSNILDALDPTIRRPLIDPQNIIFIQGVYDNIVRPSWIERWHEAWDGSYIVRTYNGHCSTVKDSKLIDQIARFVQNSLQISN